MTLTSATFTHTLLALCVWPRLGATILPGSGNINDFNRARLDLAGDRAPTFQHENEIC
jgi:hypothetical protein